MLKFLRKFVYKLKLEKKLRTMNVVDMIKTLVKYNKMYSPAEYTSSNDGFFALSGCNGPGIYDIFYRNLHLYYKYTEKENIFRISIKNDEDRWELGERFSENTKTMEVYLTYDIEVLGGRRCSNTIFKDGTWNEYVYKTLVQLEKMVNGYTIEAEFNEIYSNRKWESGE